MGKLFKIGTKGLIQQRRHDIMLGISAPSPIYGPVKNKKQAVNSCESQKPKQKNQFQLQAQRPEVFLFFAGGLTLGTKNKNLKNLSVPSFI